MSTARDIDVAIDRFDEALRAAGIPGVEPPDDFALIAEVAQEVAPYVLPAELRRYWERVDPDRMAVFTFPTLGGPAHALHQVRGLREFGTTFPGVPPVLLPVDYASHSYGVIELGSEWSEGGSIFVHDFDGFEVVSRSVADRVDVLAELLAEGHFERGDGYVSIDHLVEQRKRLERLAAAGPDPLYGDVQAIPVEIESWPAHWLVASGIDLRDRVPLGATHTIAELIAGAGAGRVTGRIHGTVTVLVGSDAGSRLVVEDHTGTLEVWCPAGASLWGPVHRLRFELTITLEAPPGPSPDVASPHADITQYMLAGDIASAQDAALALFEQLDRDRSAAVASDIRPLD